LIIYQRWIYRDDLQANPDIMYLFGDNVDRIGRGGQAKEMRGEPNAHGIATKVSPSNHPNAFFNDEKFLEQSKIIFNDFSAVFGKIAKGGTVIIPLYGLGSGLSQLPEKAPGLNTYLLRQIAYLTEIDKRIRR